MPRDLFDPLVDTLAKAKLPTLPTLPLREMRIKTPLGDVSLPSLPSPPTSLNIDERRRKVIKYTIGADAASIFGLLPWVGQFLAEQGSDLFMEEAVKSMSKEEIDRYMLWEKRFPTNFLPMLASFGTTR